MQAAKALASLHICTDLLEPLLLTDAISMEISCVTQIIVMFDIISIIGSLMSDFVIVLESYVGNYKTGLNYCHRICLNIAVSSL